MSASLAIDHDAAVTLIAAAATAAGPCPTGAASKWEHEVQERAEGLLRLVPALVERSEVLSSCQPVTGVIVKVEEVKGRGLITSHATMGNPQRNQEVVDGRAVEHFRTAWLNEPAGKALFDQASSLIGRHCRFGKRIEEGTDAKGDALKVRMVEWIEDLGPDPKTREANGQQAPRQSPRPAPSAPRGQAQAAPGGDTDWFAANGWRDQAHEHEQHRLVVDTLTGSSDDVKAAHKAWMGKMELSYGTAWTTDQHVRIKAKMLELLDAEELAEEQRQPAAVGGGNLYYAPGEEPF